MARNAWLTPDAPGVGYICRPLFIPNGLDWLAIVTGALNELIYDYNFEEYGTESISDSVAEFQKMFDHFCFNDETGCRMIGEIVTFAGPTSPSPNWLSCDGASLLRTDYPDLFTVIGTTYGAVDSSHFNTPNLIGRVAVGAGSTGGLSPHSLGDAFGDEEITLGIGSIPSHSHSDLGHSHAEGSAAPTIGAAITGVPVPSAVPSVGVTGSGSANISSTGGDGPHDNIQPSIALNYFIVAL
jgi:microcystin-dependent protein